MQQRLDAMKVSPAAYKAMAGLQSYVDQSGLERSLLELVKIRTRRSTAAHSASSCTPTKRASTARPTTGCIC